MSPVFHDIEKKIITELRKSTLSTPEKLERQTNLSTDQIRRGVEWLRLKKLVTVDETVTVTAHLGKNGIDALEHGLAERRLLDMIRAKPQTISDLQKQLGSLFGPAVGLAKRNGWIKTDNNNKISLENYPDTLPAEQIISVVGKAGSVSLDSISERDAYDSLKKRPDFVVERATKSRVIGLADSAKDLDVGAPSQRGGGNNNNTAAGGAIDVEADVPLAFSARRHPLKETINEIREIFVTLGFTEISGNLTQSSFWNFDALFTPQDHPAREMQDTFFLDGDIRAKRIATAQQIKNVSAAHTHNWRYRWDVDQAKKMVLRTHTTCVTIKHLAENKLDDESRVFSLGRVFRNEKTSYKHLVEFNQVECAVTGKNSTLVDLMGIQKEFYRRIGITKVKFWPTFFPYTEPSLQTMVYNKRLDKWVELFGMGIFRPEVTRPLGITKPVLACGGGIERIAMLKYGLDDVRQFYNNDLDWLRNASKCR